MKISSKKNSLELLRNSDEIGQKFQDYQISSQLGLGTFGIVYKVLCLKSQQEYVLKKINIKNMKQKHQKEAIKEVQILRKVNHQNIIKYYTSFIDEDFLYIIMEYAQGGDLQHVIL